MLIKLLAMKNAYMNNEDGATAIEYALLAAGIALVIIGVVFTLGGQVQDTFQGISDGLKNKGK